LIPVVPGPPKSPSLSEQLATTPLSGANADYLEALYEQYLADPAGVDPDWRRYFDALPTGPAQERAHGPIIAAVAARTQAGPAPAASSGAASEKQAAVSRLCRSMATAVT
jgi:2-oxoglutarate dehydrogenase E1 component